MLKFIFIYAAGATLLIFLYVSLVKNIRLIREKTGKKQLLVSDIYINYPLLFIWLAFMAVLALGLVINNTWPE